MQYLKSLTNIMQARVNELEAWLETSRGDESADIDGAEKEIELLEKCLDTLAGEWQ